MSSRALRKLQKEREQQKQIESTNQDVEDEDESDEHDIPTSKPKALNAFSMLNEEENDNDEENDDVNESDERKHSVEDEGENKIDVAGKPKAKSKAKKKKNKKKTRGTEEADTLAKEVQGKEEAPQLDEIDRALQSLSTKSKTSDAVDPSASTRVAIDEANSVLYRLLAVESKHLNALNEMKRLFGNVVMENEVEPVEAPRRRGRGAQQLDLGAALAGRNNPASRGQGLTGLALRRNPFIQGKEEWPKATSGGLSTELVEKFEDGTVEYRFVHNTIYQDVQRQFETCVESMNPTRMITLLQYNPYHISTLLQVSEIAKQQGDHSVSGDLLERALFSFGRAVQSFFTTAMTEGKARFDFRRPENREFWLAAWRYINNLGQRGTWRTAYEWAKLVLSLDPEGDPYRVSLIIDQLALRGGQSEHFLNLANTPFFKDDLWALPNIFISKALAEYKLKQAQKSRDSLTKAIHDYPYIFNRLFQSLSIDHIPKSIWGKTPKTDREMFDCEMYVHNAKDLWNTPEVVAFLVEVVESAGDSEKPPDSTLPDKGPITSDEARHVLLSGVPALINLIPREFTTRSSSASDPLPPSDNLPSYTAAAPADAHRVYESPFEVADGFETPPDEETPNPRSPEEGQVEVGNAQNFQGLRGFFRRLLPAGFSNTPTGRQQFEELIRQEGANAAEQGVPRELTAEQGERLMQVLGTLGPEEDGFLNSDIQREDGPDPRDPHAPTIEDVSDSDSETSNPPQIPTAQQIGPSEPYDDDRNQRWLAGQGMLRLKAASDEFGTDESAWPSNSSAQSILREFAQRMLQLRQQRTRDFLLNFTLRQGTSVEVKEMVLREIERCKPGR